MTNVMCFNQERQNGAALIIIVFILAIALTSYILKEMNTQSIQVEHQQRVRERLNDAKQALLAWAVTNSVNPGEFPYPDRDTGGGYDGRGDCPFPIVNPFNRELLIGQLPIYGSDGCNGNQETGLGVDSEDGYGNRLWYAVSPNLVRDYSASANGVVNPPINSDLVNATNWLIVLDHSGNIISDRVAAVIIAPGDAIGNQSRSNTALKENYLDSFQKDGAPYSNSDYDTDEEDFIMGASMDTIGNDPSYTRPYLFNDQLVYITIDELMVALEKRVAREAVSKLRDYFNTYGYYPYASRDNGNNSCQLVDSFGFGLLPLIGDCLEASLMLPNWFEDNGWDGLLFYAVSSSCTKGSACATGTLRVGAIDNVNALVISTGAALLGQNRAILNLSAYMDSPENTNADLNFDAVGTPLTNTYNDQMFIVAP